MDRHRIFGEIVSTIHVLWQLGTALIGFGAVICMLMMVCALLDLESNFAWLMARLTICATAYYAVQTLVMKTAQRIWGGECPMLLLEKSLFMRDNEYYNCQLRSPFCKWLARYGVHLSPDGTVFTAVMALALGMNALLFVPVVYILFAWL